MRSRDDAGLGRPDELERGRESHPAGNSDVRNCDEVGVIALSRRKQGFESLGSASFLNQLGSKTKSESNNCPINVCGHAEIILTPSA